MEIGKKVMEHIHDHPLHAPHFIGGEFAGMSGYFEDLCPHDNSVIARVADGGQQDVERAVLAAAKAFRVWSRTDASERSRIMNCIADGIEERVDEIALLETLDTGIPIRQTRGQVKRAAENFRFFAKVCTLIGGRSYTDNGFLNYTLKQPAGVAGLITPWNTPFMLETWKVAPCLSAGDTCILKPAEWAPLTACLLAEIIASTDLPRGAFNVVHGIGERAGAALVSSPGVRLISFTGETSTGMEIMRNGASTLKRFSMELGGKSPAIVFEDANLRRALDATIYGVFSLNGERCTANSRIFVHSSIYDDFLDAVVSRVSEMIVGDPFEEETEVGPLIHPEHLKRVKAYVDSGIQEGAVLECGGGGKEVLERGNYIQPAVFSSVRNDMRIAQEEIFGPVVVLLPFSSEEEVCEMANDTRYGLASYVWTEDMERAQRVAQSMEAGMCWVNSHNVRDLRLPFGGSKYSGIGREGGEYSFDFYMEEKSVQVALGKHSIPAFGRVSKNSEK